MARENMRDALRLAQAGMKVFPLHTATEGRCDCGEARCASPAKHPWVKDWPNLAANALNDVLSWWKERPAANIGVACGASGLVVIDMDPRNGGEQTLIDWQKAHGPLPEGPRVITGGGGMHFYFRHPGGVVQSRSGIALGIDCKADGGYVVAPTSIHASGTSYTWVDGFGPQRELPDLPEWLLLLVQRREKATVDAPRAVPMRIPEGQRHQVLHSFGSGLRAKGLSEAVIFRSLMALNEEACVPPMDRGEVAELAADIHKRYEPTEAFVVSSKPEPVRARDIRPYTAAELEYMELQPPPWAVPGMLPLGLTIIVGQAKLGKSWMVLDMALQIAEGGIVMEAVPVEDGDVLYVALEDNQLRMKGRIRQIHPEQGWPERLEIIDLSHRMPRMDEGGLEFLDAWLGQHPDAKLVIIDTLQRFRSRQGTRKNAYQADVEEMEQFQELAMRHIVAIAFVHHTNKGLHADVVDTVSGSTGISGTADTTWILSRPRGKSGQSEGRLRITGRDVEEQDYRVVFSEGRWRLEGDFEEQSPSAETPAIQELLTFMRRKPWATYDAGDVQAGLGKETPEAARMLLKRAWAAGVISKAGRGQWQLPEHERTSIEQHVLFGSVVSERNKPLVPDTQEPNRTEQQNNVTERNNENRTRPETWPDLPKNLVGLACPTCKKEEPWVWTGHGWACGECRPHLRIVGGAE